MTAPGQCLGGGPPGPDLELSAGEKALEGPGTFVRPPFWKEAAPSGWRRAEAGEREGVERWAGPPAPSGLRGLLGVAPSPGGAICFCAGGTGCSHAEVMWLEGLLGPASWRPPPAQAAGRILEVAREPPRALSSPPPPSQCH